MFEQKIFILRQVDFNLSLAPVFTVYNDYSGIKTHRAMLIRIVSKISSRNLLERNRVTLCVRNICDDDHAYREATGCWAELYL